MAGRSYRWMETLLDTLLRDYERDACVKMVSDPAARHAVSLAVRECLEGSGMEAGFLQTTPGDNLFVAVLGLRLKFSPDEARAKVALNIAMREGRA